MFLRWLGSTHETQPTFPLQEFNKNACTGVDTQTTQAVEEGTSSGYATKTVLIDVIVGGLIVAMAVY